MSPEFELEKRKLYFKERNEMEYPVRRDTEIIPGKVYRSRVGDRIKVYSVEGKEIHGAINVKGSWQVDTWNTDGTYMDGGKSHDRDIVLSKPLVLRPGAKYRSRDGRPIEVYGVNKGSIDFPVIGGIKEGNNWLPRVWDEKGVCKRPYGPNNDIVTEWSQS